MIGLLFGIIAAFYASVGFGGGSSYIALLALVNTPYTAIPIIALVCNIIVVSGNSFHYIRAGYLNLRLILPPVIASVPMAYLGGKLEIGQNTFLILLFITLAFTGIRLLIKHKDYTDDAQNYHPLPIPIGLILGAILGFTSGLVGIGGGIFLAPILYNLKAASPKQIAACASIFILVNSCAGLIGQLHKSGINANILEYSYLPIILLIGVQIGNLFSIKFISPPIIALLTSLLVLFVAARLGYQIWF